MYETINDLFHGSIQPHEELRSDSEYAEAERVFTKIYDKVMERLGDDELQECFADALADFSHATESVMFRCGFRLGARLTAESFADV